MKVIDVSYWQHDIDFRAVKNSGVEGVIVRIGWGEIKDPSGGKWDAYCIQNINRCKEVGLPVELYFYSYAQTAYEAQMEANFVINAISSGELPNVRVWYDVEDEDYQGHVDVNPVIDTFCTMLKDRNIQTGVYSFKSWFDGKINHSIREKYNVWLAHWDIESPSLPCDIWQYSEAGRVPGINGDCDLNIAYNFNGSPENVNPAPPTPPTLEPIYPETVFSTLELQRVLRMLNYGPFIDLDGEDGSETQGAVMNAQRGYCIDVDGKAGKVTEYYLRGQLRSVQTRLNELGFSCTIDGRLGDYGIETTNAVERFQESQGLGVDWIVGEDTFNSLFNQPVNPITPPVHEPLPEGMARPHFSWSEFECECVRLGKHYCDGFPVKMSEWLLDIAEATRVDLGAELMITSGIRCYKQNEDDGGVAYSKHKTGEAFDCYTHGMSEAMVDRIADIAESHGARTIRYYGQSFVHVEV